VANEFDALVLHGDGTEPALLEKAKPEKALVVAVLRDDEPLFPEADLELRQKDLLLILVADQEVLDEVRERLREEGEGEDEEDGA
jgi:Trk K+ transport system NAD-binding subunit